MHNLCSTYWTVFNEEHYFQFSFVSAKNMSGFIILTEVIGTSSVYSFRYHGNLDMLLISSPIICRSSIGRGSVKHLQYQNDISMIHIWLKMYLCKIPSCGTSWAIHWLARSFSPAYQNHSNVRTTISRKY